MTNSEWDSWIEHHAALFYMHTPHDGLLFAAWRPMLDGYSFSELKEASSFIACDPQKSALFRDKHLGLIRSRIHGKRYERQRAERAEFDSKHQNDACKICNGTGWVNVVHPRSMRDGTFRLPWYDLLVYCSCQKGISRHSKMNEDLAKTSRDNPIPKKLKEPSTIDAYEFLYPDWREIVEQREAARRGESVAEYHARQADLASPITRDKVREVVSSIGARGDADES